MRKRNFWFYIKEIFFQLSNLIMVEKAITIFNIGKLHEGSVIRYFDGEDWRYVMLTEADIFKEGFQINGNEFCSILEPKYSKKNYFSLDVVNRQPAFF